MTTSRIEFDDHDDIGDSFARYIDWSAQPEHGSDIIGFEIGDHQEHLNIPLTRDELGELLDDIDNGQDCYACADEPRLPGITGRFFDWSTTDDGTLLLIIGYAEHMATIRLHSAEFHTLSATIRATLP